MAENDFTGYGQELSYDYDIRFEKIDDDIILAVAFIPDAECSEAIVNSYIGMITEAIDIAFEYGAKITLFRDEENYNVLSNLFNYEKLHFMYFLLFPNEEKLTEYVARLTVESIL